jgi:hypothetical protein
MFETCFGALISGVIGINNLGLALDTNNHLIYSYGNERTQYVVADKYNTVELCQKGQRITYVDVPNKFDLVKTID